MATGKDIYTKALTKEGQAYIEGTLVPKDDPNWTGPWDCAELCSWAVFQTSAILYGSTNDRALPAHADAYSGAWKNDAETAGIIITTDIAASIPGAMVLRAPTSALGGHIVISDGTGGTIEAKGKLWGVVKDTLQGRRWDFGILVPGITYAGLPPVTVSAPTATVYRYTDPMMVSAKVGEIQRALTAAGFSTKGVDNIFGANTLNAVMNFQRAKGLLTDGEVGKETAAALNIIV